MTWHAGRLIDHIHLRAHNFVNTRFFYEQALAALGIRIEQKGEGWFQVDELFVDAADARTVPTHVHLAFQAKDRAALKRAPPPELHSRAGSAHGAGG